MNTYLKDWVAETNPFVTKKIVRRPDVDHPIPQESVPWRGFKRCREIWYITGRQLPSYLFRRDRVVSRRTPDWWNEIYTAAYEQEREKAVAMKSPERVQFRPEKCSVYADFACLVIDVKRRHPDIAMIPTLLNWFEPIGRWWEFYLNYYFHADPEIQEVFYHRFKYITDHRQVEVRDFISRLPRDQQDIPWCAKPRGDEFVSIEDWIESL